MSVIKNVNSKVLPIITVMLAALVTLSPFAIDSYLAAMPLMSKFFNVPINIVQLTITSYFLGFAFGNFIGGPLSDSFGRKPIALTGVLLYALASIVIPICNSVEQVIALRVLQAFGGGFATVTANVFIRDWFSGKELARLVTVVSMMMMLAPLFAPVIGSFLVEWEGWKGVFYFLFVFAIVLFVLFYILIPESRDKQLITRKITSDQMFGKYKVFFSHKPSVMTLFAVSFSMSGMYIFLTTASFIYIEYFKISASMFPLVFGANVLLNIVLSLFNTFLLKKYRPMHILRTGLVLQLLAGVLLLITVMFGQPSFVLVFVGIVVFIGSLGLIFGNGTAVILNHNPNVAGSANATIGIMRFVLSFIIGSLIALFHTEDLIPVCVGMFLCTLVGNLLYSIVMKQYKKMDQVAEL